MSHGGRREGSGRKKGTGTSNKIKKYVDEFMFNLLEDEKIKKQIYLELQKAEIFEGWIYVIKTKKEKSYKIGVTQRKNPKDRLRLYKSHQIDFELIYIDKVNYCYEIESDIHDFLNEYRIGKTDYYKCDDFKIIEVLSMVSRHKNSSVFTINN